MRVMSRVFAIAAMTCLAAGVARTAPASEWNKETVLTFSRDVQVPGRVLPAGRYVFKLSDSLANRHVVQVFDGQGRMLATVFSIPAVRSTAGGTHILFEGAPTGAPARIKAWFYPGQLGGQAFIYPAPQ